MDSADELPDDYFLDADEAEQEYYAAGPAIRDAEEKLKLAQARLHTVQAVYNRFAGTPGVAAVARRSSWDKEENVLNQLNLALNPYWLPPDGRISPDKPPNQWQGSLIVQNVESETCRDEVIILCLQGAGYIDVPVPFSYESRVEQYTMTADARMSKLEKGLREIREEATQSSDALGCKGLLDKLIRQVGDITTLPYLPVVLTFHPDLAPTNIDERKRIRSSIDQSAIVRKRHKLPLSYYLEWPPLTKYAAPKPGEYYGLASYKGICWVCHGSWEPYQFPPEELRAVRERIQQIDDRLRERVAAATREVKAVEEEIASLRRRRDAVRSQHYPQLVYKELWSEIQNTGHQDSA